MYYRSLFRSAPQLNAFLMKIFLDSQIISHSLQGGYQSSLSGSFFFLYIYMYLCVRVYIYPPVLQEANVSATAGGEGKISIPCRREGGRESRQESLLAASPMGLGAPSLSLCSQRIIKRNKNIARVGIGGQQAVWGWGSLGGAGVVARPKPEVSDGCSYCILSYGR